MSKRKGKTVSFDAMVKFFMQNYNIPTKNDVDKLMAKLDHLETLIRTSTIGPCSSKAQIGRRKALRLGTTGLIILMSILSIVVTLKQPLWIAILFVPVGFFWMTVIVNVFPVLWNLSPRSDEGAYTGIYYSFNQAAYVFGPVIMGLVFDFIGKGMGSDKYLLMFPFIVFCEICAFVLLYGVKGGDPTMSEERIETLSEEYIKAD